MMRKKISIGRFGAMPQRNDASVKPVTDDHQQTLAAEELASQPVIGRMIALATR